MVPPPFAAPSAASRSASALGSSIARARRRESLALRTCHELRASDTNEGGAALMASQHGDQNNPSVVQLPGIDRRRSDAASDGPACVAIESKSELLKQLHRERHLRTEAESEAARLRAALGDTSQDAKRLTGGMLQRHEKQVAAGRHSEEGSGRAAGVGERAAEVLQWKHLVRHHEQHLQNEDEERRQGAKITLDGYCSSEARYEFRAAARARQATKREQMGSLRLGTVGDVA
mmetsp:Transcript_54359/g.151415  ORF Transcript_54359/g.151415 Transcript_54359/m.151415 type:complete len:233 (+) Transcript_54359:57-755(+)